MSTGGEGSWDRTYDGPALEPTQTYIFSKKHTVIHRAIFANMTPTKGG